MVVRISQEKTRSLLEERFRLRLIAIDSTLYHAHGKSITCEMSDLNSGE